MKSKFDNISIKCSKMTTRAYSTSFSLGIYFLSNTIRDHIYAIYGFVRFADEIVDSFHGYDKKILLQKFKNETYESIASGISLNPILNSFQNVVNQFNIDHELIETFFNSMEMDLNATAYNKENYEKYILGSAEVVGLMCLFVFVSGDKSKYNELKFSAMKLGAAFQKVNFLRDLKDDYALLGRTYFPNVDLTAFTVTAKNHIENEIEADFKQALIGLRKLPASSRCGVYLAFIYYKKLLHKIKNVEAKKIMTKRIRISNGQKLWLMLNSMFQYKLNLL